MEKIDIELEKCWDMTESWLDEINSRSYRSLCRIGTSIEKKNDQRRVDQSRELCDELSELSQLFFEESGLLSVAEEKLNYA